MINRPCEKCHKNLATERHHKFSQTKMNRKKYGKLIDDKKNIMYLCYNCHHNKLNREDKWNEKEFCINLGIDIICK
jgi:hypothetical protein